MTNSACTLRLKGRLASGFTLVELLVVIGIIAILGALLFPTLSRARNSALTTACASNLKQLGNAIQLYSQDWDGIYPLAVDFADASPRGREGWRFFPEELNPDAQKTVMELVALPDRRGFIDQVLKNYTKTQDLWRCPSDTGLQYEVVQYTWGGRFYTFFHGDITGDQTAFEKYQMSYGYRTELGMAGWSVDQGKSVADLVVLSDMAGYWHTRFNRYGREDAVADTSDTVKWAMNVLFGDGHVKHRTWDEYIDATHRVGPSPELYEALQQ